MAQSMSLLALQAWRLSRTTVPVTPTLREAETRDQQGLLATSLAPDSVRYSAPKEYSEEG